MDQQQDKMKNTVDFKVREGAKKASKGLRPLIICAAAVLLVIIVVSSCTFTVGQAEQAVVSQLGVIKQIVLAEDNTFAVDNPDLMNSPGAKLQNISVIYGKGLFFKVPFITDVVKQNSRLFPYVSDSNPVNTAEKKQYYITIYARWQIANPALFSITQQSQSRANDYLDNLVFPSVVQRVNLMTGDDFINNKDVLNSALADAVLELNRSVRDSGIRIADIQIHRTSLPPANVQSTYERMQADRAKVAQQLRSEGQEAYEKAVASSDREASVMVAESVRDAEIIKGQGDAEAMRIYADAYRSNEEFYAFWRSLKALEASIGKNDTLVLDQNHPLWSDLLQWAKE